MADRKLDKPRGVLHSGAVLPAIRHWRYRPSPGLAPFVEHYWTVEWDLREPVVRETLPHPVVHVVLEADDATLAGPGSRRFVRTLAGKGRVFGIKFRAGGFRAFVDGPVSAYADRTIPLAAVFGDAVADLARRALAHDAHEGTIAVLEAFLLARGARPSDVGERMMRIAERLATDRGITRIEQVTREFRIGPRTLQRQFRDHVGVHPKWVIQRYRLHEALARIDAGSSCDWAALALDLGYADQAHLIRDFRKLVGRTPAEYARSARRRDAPA